jgi:hypothetical protein
MGEKAKRKMRKRDQRMSPGMSPNKTAGTTVIGGQLGSKQKIAMLPISQKRRSWRTADLARPAKSMRYGRYAAALISSPGTTLVYSYAGFSARGNARRQEN